MRDPTAVTLGGDKFLIRPFTVKQQVQFSQAYNGIFGSGEIPKDDSDAIFRFAAHVLQIALGRSEPQVSVDTVEATTEEILAAFSAIVAANRSSSSGEAAAPAQAGANSSAS